MKSENGQNLIEEITNLKNGIQDELKVLNDLEDEMKKKLFLIKQNISSKIKIKLIDNPNKKIRKLKKETDILTNIIIILIGLTSIFFALFVITLKFLIDK